MSKPVIIIALLAAFASGYASADTATVRSRAYNKGVAEAAWYVEDCSLEDAHAQRCTIPCGGDLDCIQKNGTRDAY